MNISPNTPPKGDYAAYIEQLMREAQEAAPREGMVQASPRSEQAPATAQTPGADPTAPAAPATPAGAAAPAAPGPAAASAASAAAAAPASAAAAASSPAAGAAPAAPAPAPSQPPVKSLLEAVSGVGFLGHAKWLVLGWFVAQVLDSLVPDAGLLFYLGVLGYVGWVMATINRSSGGALAKRMRELSGKARESAQKSGLVRKKTNSES